MTALDPIGLRFRCIVDGIGELALRPVDPDVDAAVLHPWLIHPRAHFWQMGDYCREQVAEYLRAVAAHPAQESLLGLHDGRPAFLVERYDPAVVELAGAYPARPGDVGMHFLTAPPDSGPSGAPVPGFTRAVITTIMRFLLDDPAAARVVVEPDVRNLAVQVLNDHVGFVPVRVLELPGKLALLSTCDRAAFAASAAGLGLGGPADHDAGSGAVAASAPGAVVAHLQPDRWARATAALLAKAIGEFSHERLLDPEPDGDGWRVRSDDGAVDYWFAARRSSLDHWSVDPESVTRHREGSELELDAGEFFVELRDTLGLTEQVLPVYLEEIVSTLAGTAYKLGRSVPSAQLAHASFTEIEAGMTEGHPSFVANNGRLGFDATEYHAYAPETGAPVRLVWVAAHRRRATFSGSPGLDHDTLLAGELGVAELNRFHAVLRGHGLDPAEYLFIPVHPWQWTNRIALTFAADLARRDLVLLGEGSDAYRAQQSVRTFFNTDRPDRHYVKTALSVLNMGFVRGLSAKYMAGTPAINEWVAELVADDPVLVGCGFTILRERAAVGFHAGTYTAHAPADAPYPKMLAALWRESPVPGLAPGERLMTMAALLHVDADGAPLVAELIAASGLNAAEWVRRYLHAYLTPFVHCLQAHRLVFMPHGENVVLVLRDDAVVRVIGKDIGEEVALMDPDRPLPDAVERIRVDVPAELAPLSVLTDIVDGVLRFLAPILDRAGLLAPDVFWAEVAAVVRAVPGPYDLFVDTFALSCLNRLQLRNNRQMVDLTDPAGSLVLAGELTNPLAPHRRPT